MNETTDLTELTEPKKTTMLTTEDQDEVIGFHVGSEIGSSQKTQTMIRGCNVQPSSETMDVTG